MTLRNLIDYALDFADLVESPEKLDRPSFRALARASSLSFVPAALTRAAESFLKLTIECRDSHLLQSVRFRAES